MSREFDIVIYGASGFTGGQAVRYFARQAPAGLRWAIAGRNAASIEALGCDVPLLIADARDSAALDGLASRANVVLNMAGPFKLYGDPLVAACIRTGTTYLDISGETARIRHLIDRHHADAEAAGVKILNFCGVSSLPVDLAILLIDQQLDGRLEQATASVSIIGGAFNGGTVASIVDAIESGDAAIERDPFLLGPHNGRKPEAAEQDPTGLVRDAASGTWRMASPLGVSDTRAVRRTAVLRGRDIRFQEYSVFARWGDAAGFAAVMGLLGTILRFRATRRLLQRLIKPGTGPSPEQRDKSSYRLDLRGSDGEGNHASVSIQAKGDPGNDVTVICACEAAFALADNQGLPQRFGVLTPAVAIGLPLIDRLKRAGIRFETI